MSEHLILASNEAGQGLSVRYQWQRDRFQHTICVQGDVASDWLVSDEADAPSDAWPADPPLQQVSVEPIAGHDAVLAVGQAGCGHWSSSAEALTIDSLPALRFDIACRFPEPPLFLGSQYRIASDTPQVELAGGTAWLREPSGVLRLQAQVPATAASSPSQPVSSSVSLAASEGDTDLAAIGDVVWQFDASKRLLRLAVNDPGQEVPRTARWQLTVTWQPAS